MRLIERVIGARYDTTIAEALHRLEHRGAVDELRIEAGELQRRRFRSVTAGGEEVAVALPRDQVLHDGAVLVLEADRALLVRVTEPRWLRLVPRDPPAAIELGYLAGNLHWRVRFGGGALLVAVEGSEDGYRERLAKLLETDAVTIAEAEP